MYVRIRTRTAGLLRWYVCMRSITMRLCRPSLPPPHSLLLSVVIHILVVYAYLLYSYHHHIVLTGIRYTRVYRSYVRTSKKWRLITSATCFHNSAAKISLLLLLPLSLLPLPKTVPLLSLHKNIDWLCSTVLHHKRTHSVHLSACCTHPSIRPQRRPDQPTVYSATYSYLL